jgi:hypothetical protein
VKIEKVKSINEFINIIYKVRNISNPYEKMFYRGQGNCSWSLLPSISRNNALFDSRSFIIQKIIKEKPMDFTNLNYFNTLVKLQHYGVPTRLLDFTENPLVALFFACKDVNNDKGIEQDGEVFFHKMNMEIEQGCNMFIANFMSFLDICDVRQLEPSYYTFLNQIPFYNTEFALQVEILKKKINNSDSESFGNWIFDVIRQSKFMIPELLNDRIIRQQGLFCICANVLEHKKTQEVNLTNFIIKNEFIDFKKDLLGYMNCRIIIDGSSKEYILKQLNSIGMNEAYLFPELNTYCNYVVNSLMKN